MNRSRSRAPFWPAAFGSPMPMCWRARSPRRRRCSTAWSAVANDLGLLAEEFDSGEGRQTGNFPQALTHIALINTAHNLSDATKAGREAGHAAVEQAAEVSSGRSKQSWAGACSVLHLFSLAPHPAEPASPEFIILEGFCRRLSDDPRVGRCGFFGLAGFSRRGAPALMRQPSTTRHTAQSLSDDRIGCRRRQAPGSAGPRAILPGRDRRQVWRKRAKSSEAFAEPRA